MAKHTLEYLGKSEKYSHVYYSKIHDGTKMCQGVIKRKGRFYKSKYIEDERKCALWVDKKLIELGECPVNVLVKKT